MLWSCTWCYRNYLKFWNNPWIMASSGKGFVWLLILNIWLWSPTVSTIIGHRHLSFAVYPVYRPNMLPTSYDKIPSSHFFMLIKSRSIFISLISLLLLTAYSHTSSCWHYQLYTADHFFKFREKLVGISGEIFYFFYFI